MTTRVAGVTTWKTVVTAAGLIVGELTVSGGSTGDGPVGRIVGKPPVLPGYTGVTASGLIVGNPPVLPGNAVVTPAGLMVGKLPVLPGITEDGAGIGSIPRDFTLAPFPPATAAVLHTMTAAITLNVFSISLSQSSKKIR